MKRNRLFFCPAALALAGACWAQAPGAAPAPAGDKGVSVSKVVRLNRVPISKEPLRVKLPKPVELKMENGATVLVVENHRLPEVSFEVYLPGAGGLTEPTAQRGLAGFVAQMLREGAGSRDSKQIADTLALLGAQFGAGAGLGSEGATLQMSVLRENLDPALELFADLLLRPTFSASEWGKMKQRQRAALIQQRSSPQFLGLEQFNRQMYGDFPAAAVAPTLASLDAVTPDAMKAWHDARYAPQRAIIGVAGDITPAEVTAKLKKALGEWKRTDFQPGFPPNPKPATTKRIALVDRPGSVQTTLNLGNLAIDRRSPDYVQLTVMNKIVGGGPAARLFLNLREEKGYTYGVYSNLTAAEYPGPWRAGGDVRTDVTEGALREFMNEFKRIRDEKVPQAELDEAKGSIVAAFALSLEQPEQVLQYEITRRRYNLPANYWDEYPAMISKITADDIQRVARKYLNLDALQVAAVGDAAKIKTILETYGPVEVYTTEGTPKVQP